MEREGEKEADTYRKYVYLLDLKKYVWEVKTREKCRSKMCPECWTGTKGSHHLEVKAEQVSLSYGEVLEENSVSVVPFLW